MLAQKTGDWDEMNVKYFSFPSRDIICFYLSGSEGRMRPVWTRLPGCRPSSSLPVIANRALDWLLIVNQMFNRALLLLWFSRWFNRGIWLKARADNNANPTNPKLLIANNRICGRRSPSVVLLTKLTLCVILNLLVSSCSFLLLRWIAKFITERQCDRVELDLHANRAIRMSIQSIAMHYMCFLFLSTDALNSLKMFSHSGWR